MLSHPPTGQGPMGFIKSRTGLKSMIDKRREEERDRIKKYDR
jgi:hypothetical protein